MFFFFSSRRRHTRCLSDWSSDVCSSDLPFGKADVEKACTMCHGVDQIVAQHRAPDEWAEVVTRMVGFGATLTDQQHADVLAYRSEERRVGKECRRRVWRDRYEDETRRAA